MVEEYQKILSEHKIKYYFQGQPTESKYWFCLDLDWIEETFLTREPGLFKRIYQKHIPVQADK